jgi:hypothetical protein
MWEIFGHVSLRSSQQDHLSPQGRGRNGRLAPIPGEGVQILMSVPLTRIAQARELSPADRTALVEEVLDSLDSTDPAIDHLWIREAKDRLEAYRRGDLAAKDLSEIVAKYGLWPSAS